MTDTPFWEIFDPAAPFVGAHYGGNNARMVFIGLGNGELLVVTPGALPSEERWAEVAQWGRPRFLLAPNHFHNSGLGAWKTRFPDAEVVAHPTAVPRLRKKLTGIAVSDLTALNAALPPHVRLLSPPGARQGETWVSVDTAAGRAWFVTDSIINEPRMPGPPLGWLGWAVGFRAGLMTNPFFKRLFLPDKAAYKLWVAEQLEREPPALFVPAHGDPLQGPDLLERLTAITAAA